MCNISSVDDKQILCVTFSDVSQVINLLETSVNLAAYPILASTMSVAAFIEQTWPAIAHPGGEGVSVMSWHLKKSKVETSVMVPLWL